jgi:hypothetical protein
VHDAELSDKIIDLNKKHRSVYGLRKLWKAAVRDDIVVGTDHVLVTPETLLRWHRELSRHKWKAWRARRGPGRPPLGDEIVELIVRLRSDEPLKAAGSTPQELLDPMASGRAARHGDATRSLRDGR